MKMKKVLVFLVLFFSSLSVSWATDYYIDWDGGNDSNNGTSTGSAWDTIGKANSTLQAGDTVYIRAGSYEEAIHPDNSGTSTSNYITYTNYNGETVSLEEVSTAINLIGKDYIMVDGINVDGEEIGDSAHIDTWIDFNNGSYNVIKNCDFQKAYGWSCIRLTTTDTHNNSLINNTMQYCGSYDRDNGDMINIENGHHNLVEGNTASYGGHNILSVDGPNNIIRNNDFSNPWERVAEIRKYDGNGTRNLVENNRFHGALPERDGNPIPPAVKLLGEHQIIRRNFIYDNTAYGFQISPASDMLEANDLKVYHNVFYDNGLHAIRLWYNQLTVDTSGNRFKNNIFYKNGSNYELQFKPETGGFNDNRFFGNNIFRTSTGQEIINFFDYGDHSLAWYESNYSGYFADNVELDPGFVDKDNWDFNLESDSLMIDAGVFLTVITSSTGSGTSFVVDDADYFMDGWDMIEGDEIQLEGDSTTITVTDVNYSTDTITVDESISWTQGDGVSLPYSGDAPDIGAIEYSSEEPDTEDPVVTAFVIPSTATSLTVTITTFTATDNTAVTGYLVNESASEPSLGDGDWSGSAQSQYIFDTEGSKTLYAWAKDVAGNISSSLNDSVAITLPPPEDTVTAEGITLSSGVTIN